MLKKEFFYLIGGICLLVLYFLIGFPTLVITNTNNKPSVKARVKGYLISTTIGIVVFILFFSRISESNTSEIYEIIIPYSVLVGALAGIFYFTPIEIMRILKTESTE